VCPALARNVAAQVSFRHQVVTAGLVPRSENLRRKEWLQPHFDLSSAHFIVYQDGADQQGGKGAQKHAVCTLLSETLLEVVHQLLAGIQQERVLQLAGIDHLPQQVQTGFAAFGIHRAKVVHQFSINHWKIGFIHQPDAFFVNSIEEVFRHGFLSDLIQSWLCFRFPSGCLMWAECDPYSHSIFSIPAKRCFMTSIAWGLLSTRINSRSNSRQTAPTVPLPAKKSITVSPELEEARIMRRSTPTGF